MDPPNSDMNTVESFLFQVNNFVGEDPTTSDNKDIFSKTIVTLNSLLENTEILTTQQVVNLSSRTLDEHELSVLSKGLSFCPTPGEPKKGDLVWEYFHDNFRWEYHFKDNPLPVPPFDKLVMLSKVLKKTHRLPPPPAHKNLEAFIFLNERDLNKERLMEPRSKNLSIEKRALLTLKRD